MFIRRKPNKSGTFSVQVVSKLNGKYKLEKSFGASSDEEDLKGLEMQVSEWISRHTGQMEIDFSDHDRKENLRLTAEGVLDNINTVLLNGPFLILARIYDSIGSNLIDDDMLRDLSIARVCEPMSKLVTVGDLKTRCNRDVAFHDVYRYMELYNTQQPLIQKQQMLEGKKEDAPIDFYPIKKAWAERRKTEDTLSGKQESAIDVAKSVFFLFNHP